MDKCLGHGFMFTTFKKALILTINPFGEIHYELLPVHSRLLEPKYGDLWKFVTSCNSIQMLSYVIFCYEFVIILQNVRQSSLVEAITGKYFLFYQLSCIGCNRCVAIFTLFYLYLTHRGQDEMAAIYQTSFSIAFSWTKMNKFRLKFHWSLFPRI